jgi:hypothetical protein
MFLDVLRAIGAGGDGVAVACGTLEFQNARGFTETGRGAGFVRHFAKDPVFKDEAFEFCVHWSYPALVPKRFRRS